MPIRSLLLTLALFLHGRVLRQNVKRGASKPGGFRVGLTVAK